MNITLALKGGIPLRVGARDRPFTKTAVRGTMHAAVDLA